MTNLIKRSVIRNLPCGSTLSPFPCGINIKELLFDFAFMSRTPPPTPTPGFGRWRVVLRRIRTDNIPIEAEQNRDVLKTGHRTKPRSRRCRWSLRGCRGSPTASDLLPEQKIGGWQLQYVQTGAGKGLSLVRLNNAYAVHWASLNCVGSHQQMHIFHRDLHKDSLCRTRHPGSTVQRCVSLWRLFVSQNRAVQQNRVVIIKKDRITPKYSNITGRSSQYL